MAKNVGVISAGAWGTAVAKVLADNGHNVEIWDFMKDVVEEINTKHSNSRYLLQVKLPHNLTATSDIIKAATGKDFIIIASPSLYLANTARDLCRAESIQKAEAVIGVLTKGFVAGDDGPLLITDAIEANLPAAYKDSLVYIAGPSHAEEVSRGKLTGLISASKNGKNSIKFRSLLNGKPLMVFSSFDSTGVQVAAAVKNVVAIAFGILDAIMELAPGFGDNTGSLLLAAGLNEIMTIGIALGSTHPETYTSIAGVGDLDVTCRSRHGRNRRFGGEIVTDHVIARFKDLDDLIAGIPTLGYLPEGVVAAKYVKQLAEKHKLKLPICTTVYRILNREIEPVEAVNIIMESLMGTSEMNIT